MTLPAPRHYQERGIKLMRKAYSDGYRNIMLFLATGGGKSVIFLHLINNLLNSGKPTVLVVKRKQLVKQAYKHFKKHGIKASIVMANEKGFDPDCNLQICSIDTINRRDLSFLERFKVMLVDECHDTTSPSYRNLFKKLTNITMFLGLTASPFQVGKKKQDFWECCVKPIEMHELRDQGFLVPCVTYVPDEIDVSHIETDAKTGDFKTAPLSSFMSQLEVISDAVEDYKKYGEGKTFICFCVDKEHSIKTAYEFNQAGIECVHCDESTPQAERDAVIERLQECARIGKPFGICNVNIFSTGVDIPEAEVGILNRPTKSEILYVQQVGRLLRPYRLCGKCNQAYDNSPACYHCGYDKPAYIKKRAVLIDNSNNIDRHGDPYKVRYPVLNDNDAKEKKEKEEYEFKMKKCKFCFASYPSNKKKCPHCENENEKVTREIKQRDGTIVPYDEYSRIIKQMMELERIQLEKNLKKNWVYFQLYEKFGDAVYKYEDISIPAWVKTISDKNKEDERIYK